MSNKPLEDIFRKKTSAGFYGTPLEPGSRYNPITYEQKMIRALRPTSILGRIAELTFTSNVECGAPKARMTEPIGGIQPAEEDGQLKPQEFDYGCEEFMDIEYSFSCFRKMSKQQKAKLMCHNPGFIQKLMDADIKEGRLLLEKIMLRIMLSSVDKHNQGDSAGAESSCYNMGTPYSPIILTPDSAEDILQNGNSIFEEWNLATEEPGLGAPFVIVPTFFRKFIFNNDRLSSYYHAGNCVACPRVSGALKNKVYGFDIITSPCLPKYTLDDGRVVYPMLFGFKEATEVIVEFEQIEHDNPHPGDRSHYYGKYWDWGGKVWDGRQLAVAYITLEGK